MRLKQLITAVAIVAALSVSITVLPRTALGLDQIETGRQLVVSCKAYLQLPPDTPEATEHPQHHCAQFLASFLSAYATAERTAPDAAVQGVGTKASGACVRLPDKLTFRDMAQRVIAQSERSKESLNGPAARLARDTLEHDFPCPPAG